MNVSLRPYTEIKDSGVDWLGDVPAHWKVERLKSSVANVIDQTEINTATGQYVALEHVESWTGKVTQADGAIEFDSQVKAFQTGDVLFGKLRPYLAKVARPMNDGVCVGEFLVLRPHQNGVCAAYLERLLRSKPLIDTVNSSTFGAKMPRADWQFIGGMAVAWPPVAEQESIVRFLNHADRRIGRYIRAKEKLIAVLEEQRQAIILLAVTGQVDIRTGKPFSLYKDSGVTWLGMIPAHWERRRLKTLLRSIDRRSIDGTETLLSLRRNHGVVVYAEHFSRPSQSSSLVGFKLVKPGQMVVNRLQANNGLVFCSRLEGLVSPDYSVFVTTVPVEMQFLSDLLRTLPFRTHFRRESTGLGTGTAGFLRLYDDDFLATVVSVPPKSEQRAIVAFVERASANVEAAKSAVCRQIAAQEDFSTRLTADIVTGKLDVREAAAALPEVDIDEIEAPQHDGALDPVTPGLDEVNRFLAESEA